MGILKKFYEFLEAPKYQGMESSEDEMGAQAQSTEDLSAALDKLVEDGGEIVWNNFKISVPSELNSPGEETVFLIDKGGKHAKAKSKEEVEQVVSEKILFESFRSKYKRRK